MHPIFIWLYKSTWNIASTRFKGFTNSPLNNAIVAKSLDGVGMERKDWRGRNEEVEVNFGRCLWKDIKNGGRKWDREAKGEF